MSRIHKLSDGINNARRRARRAARNCMNDKNWHGNPYDWTTARMQHRAWADAFTREYLKLEIEKGRA